LLRKYDLKNQEGFRSAVNDELSSPHVVGIDTKMLEKMNEIFGPGEVETVVYNSLVEGNHHHPKGTP
jgi:hypothetical protein